MTWSPSIGAIPEKGGTLFSVYAPHAKKIDLLAETPSGNTQTLSLPPSSKGFYKGSFPSIKAGDLYRYRLDGKSVFPDPASRFQPQGVHGPSQVIDPASFAWSDHGWKGLPLETLLIYELHVGTFSPEGSFDGVRKKLPYLRDLGVNTLELMPLSDFPGQRNWGYDGAALFAPARCYGSPESLRLLVDEAHRLGLAVLLDAVYNHLGPDGAYWPAYNPHVFSKKHKNPWGAGLNFDGEHSETVRSFLIENALHWIHEYHLDGLRLDATHAIQDKGPLHFLQELSEKIHASVPERPIHLLAEDHRNKASMLKAPSQGGWGLDGVWADDFHHQVRVCLSQEREGYYNDFSGSMPDLAETIKKGWFYCGQNAPHFQGPRGSDPKGLEPQRFVWCLQNHDQVGNRALGERLHHQIDDASYRCASALLLLSPATPLLFMGQEWAAQTPFLFFTDHNQELGRAVTEGRRREFKDFRAFSDPASREKIPDPQAESTFRSSQLNWEEHQEKKSAFCLNLYRELLKTRKEHPVFNKREKFSFTPIPLGNQALGFQWESPEKPLFGIIFFMTGEGNVKLQQHPLLSSALFKKENVVLSTENKLFTDAPTPPIFEKNNIIRFHRPAALVFKAFEK